MSRTRPENRGGDSFELQSSFKPIDIISDKISSLDRKLKALRSLVSTSASPVNECKAILKRNPEMAQYLPKEVLTDDELLIACIFQNGKRLEDASEEKRKDKKICFTALINNADAFPFIDKSLLQDEDIMLKAIHHDPTLFRFAVDPLKNKPEFFKNAVTVNPAVWQQIKEGDFSFDRP